MFKQALSLPAPLGALEPMPKVQENRLLSLENVSTNHLKHRKTLSALPSPPEIGGAERDRTVDPLLAKQVLSQLSYSPSLEASAWRPQDKAWWAWEDSNFRPHPYQGCALAN